MDGVGDICVSCGGIGVFPGRVYLDKQRSAPKGWARTRTDMETIRTLQNHSVTELSVGDDGEYVLKWVIKEARTKGYKAPEIQVHSTKVTVKDRLAPLVQVIQNLGN